MLLAMDTARRKQLAWINAILEHRAWRPSRLAKEAKINHSTLSKFLNDPLNKAQLNTYSVEKIAAVGGIPPYEVAPPHRPPGLAEDETTPYETIGTENLVDRAVAAYKNGRNGVEAWVMQSRALEHEGYVPGDILIVDQNVTPQSGDAVCAQLYSRNGTAETVMRIYDHPFLVAASSDQLTRKPHLVDNASVVIKGVIIGSFRPRRLATAA